MRVVSIRGRVLLYTAMALGVLWVLVVMGAGLSARSQIDALHDAHMSKVARLVLGLVGHEVEEHAGEGVKPDELRELQAFVHDYEQDLHLMLWGRDGVLVARSASPMPEVSPRQRRPGFFDQRVNGEHYRSFFLSDPVSGFAIQVSERLSQREALTFSVTGELLLGLALSGPLLWLGIMWGLKRGLAPLRSIARDVAERKPDDLSPVLPQGTVPQELRTLTGALNDLLQRLGRMLERERRFIADAAHELRTPLAGLKLQVQVAQKSSQPAVRDHALEQALVAADRATHVVGQLFDLARYENLDQPLQMESVEPVGLLRQVAGDLLVATGNDPGMIRVDGDESLVVRGCRPALDILMRNLLMNALQYGDPARGVEAWAGPAEAGWCLRVQDHGPGIRPDQRQTMLSRFARGGGHDVNGSGLGLSIVRRIVEAHGGKLMLDWTEAERGLTVRVLFPDVS